MVKSLIQKIKEKPNTPEQSVEQPTTPEQSVEQPTTPEQPIEQQQPVEQPTTPEQPVPQVAPVVPPTTAQNISSQEIILEGVENILSKGLDDVFLSMDQATQSTFKTRGEETAKEITTILQKAKFKVREIIDSIFKWLRIIPQVNKYYIEQEAKIKADAIMELHKNK